MEVSEVADADDCGTDLTHSDPRPGEIATVISARRRVADQDGTPMLETRETSHRRTGRSREPLASVMLTPLAAAPRGARNASRAGGASAPLCYDLQPFLSTLATSRSR